MRVEENKFGEPTPLTKAREKEYRERSSRSDAQPPAQPMPDIAGILAKLKGQTKATQQAQVQLPPVAPTPAAIDLQKLLGSFSNSSNSQQQMPPYYIGQQQSVAPNINLATPFVNPAQQNSVPQPYQPQPNLAPALPVQIDLEKILAQVNGLSQPAPQAPSAPGFGFPQNPNTLPVDNDRKRQFEGNDQDDYGKGKKIRGEPGKEKKPYYVKTLPCRFFQEGKCRKGDECTFIHE